LTLRSEEKISGEDKKKEKGVIKNQKFKIEKNGYKCSDSPSN